MRLAPYGRREWLAAGGVTIAASALSAVYFPYVAPIFVVMFFWVLWFFRDPERRVPDQPRVLVAPADGRVVEVGEVNEPEYIGGPATRVAIFLSVMNCHINRAPGEGAVEYLQHHPGRYRLAWQPQASSENERNCLGMVLIEKPGVRILVRQIAGSVARRIVCACDMNQDLKRGERIGMIKFGSRTELCVAAAAGFRTVVKVGDRVRAGETILGEFR